MAEADAIKLCHSLTCVEVEKVSVDTFVDTFAGAATDGATDPGTNSGDLDGALAASVGGGQCSAASASAFSDDKTKVSLRRYRKASHQVMGVIRRFIPESKIERIGMDEVYGDVSVLAAALVRETSVEALGAELAKAPGQLYATYADDGDGDEVESVAILAGAVICSRIRAAVLAETTSVPPQLLLRVPHALPHCLPTPPSLRVPYLTPRLAMHSAARSYVISGGVSSNKTVSKVASALNKPDHLTVVQPSEGAALILAQPVRKVPLLRGKLGRSVCGVVHEVLVPQLAADVEVTMAMVVTCLDSPHAARTLGKDTVEWLVHLCHGEDPAAVVPRLRPKSLVTSKGLGDAGVTSMAELRRWLLLLSAELVERIDEDTAHYKRRPKSLVVHHSGPDTRKAIVGGWGFTGGCSRTTRLPPAKRLTAGVITDTALAAVLKIAARLPCTAIGLAVTDFTDVISGKGSIVHFLRPRAPQLATTANPPPTGREKRTADGEPQLLRLKRQSVLGLASHTRLDSEKEAMVVGWSCQFCTFANHAAAFACLMCDNMAAAAP
jgi:nucleotidyltransferase/DNA polymerase involved in DNA repair